MSAKKPKSKDEAGKETLPSKKLRFLVVDDDDVVRRTVIEYLSSFGYPDAEEARDGVAALEILLTQKIDFVISDWEMPGASGLELLRGLRTHEALKEIPFIMITSPVSKETFKVEEAAANKVDAYLIKPFRSQVLREKIDHVLTEKKFQACRGALVVDDDDVVRETIIEYLKQMGHQPIFQARDGDEAFKTLQKHSADISIVISDWEMPKLAGIDLLKRIRSDEKLSETPFIMCTSQTSIERIKLKRALDADVDNYLLKPFMMEDLRQKVAQVMARAKVETQAGKELSLAREELKKNNWTGAEKIFQHVLSVNPKNVDALLGLASVQTHLAPNKGLEKAIQLIRNAITINPKCEQAHIDLALTFESAMSLEKAIACLRESLRECEFSEQIHFHLGRLLLRRGHQAEGMLELNKAVELKPDYKEALELLGGKA